ncbi:hypothetical protein B0T10DRAFT_75066 [Thelonectria olida]|uniref:Uncharacterized protein n=1 Tax=Thelonectria olida TaxID=1576542 RepID=A0A9P8VMQ9_9HYPO|nr:hypothetical protein B0T10DRAFT_75066 [Thelonectria olida]
MRDEHLSQNPVEFTMFRSHPKCRASLSISQQTVRKKPPMFPRMGMMDLVVVDIVNRKLVYSEGRCDPNHKRPEASPQCISQKYRIWPSRAAYGRHSCPSYSRHLLDRSIRHEVSGHIIPSTMEDKPMAPNFFLKVRGPDGSTAVATRQARYDGTMAYRGIHSLQNYSREEPQYDGQAYTRIFP